MIEWFVTSSALILLVLILRRLVRDRVNPRLRYGLWGLVMLRLLIPGTLWENPASVMTPVAAQEAYQAVERVPRYVRDRQDGWVEIGHPGGEGWTSVSMESAVVVADRPTRYGWFDPVENVTLTALREQVAIRNTFLLAWLVGSVLMGAFLLAVNLRFNRNLKKNRRTIGQYRGRWVFLLPGLATPCLFGLFHPSIYLAEELPEAEQEHVLAHEYAHFRQGDHIWAVLRGVCLVLHWYNPLVWLVAYLSRRDCELSCDEGAVRLLGEENRAGYGRTLVGLVARRTAPGDLACCATTMTGGKSALKERVALLVKRPRTTAVMAVLVAAACVMFAACTFTGAAKEPEDTPEPEAIDLSENMEPILLLAEEDIAIYYKHESAYPGTLIRYGNHLQRAEEAVSGWSPMDLCFEDLDGDGEKELAVLYNTVHGTGASVYELIVYEWDGQSWTGYRPDAARKVIDDFNASRTLTVYQDVEAAEVGYLGSSVAVDMNAAYGEQTWPSDVSQSCMLDADNYGYSIHRSGLYLHIYGAVQADGYPVDKDNILCTCAVIYHEDGTFTVREEQLSSIYPYFALTPAFREILLDYIRERQAAIGEDISADRFAVCDVNGDGRDELITQTNAASIAGQVERIYDGDGKELLAQYPVVTYYDNGYAKADWSHSQGAAGDKLWPYTLLKYDADEGEYVHVAAVDGWDKSLRDTYLSHDESVIPFPENVDKDGDGFVYYVIAEKGGYAPIYGEPMDYAEYTQWVTRCLGANVVHPGYFSLSKENIALIQ